MEILCYMTLINLVNIIQSASQFALFHSPSSIGHNSKLNSVLSTRIVERKTDCFFLCMKNPNCHSVSLNLESASRTHECILSNITADQDLPSLMKTTKWNYYEKVG